MQAMHRLFNAPYALVSHDTQADPVFNYANAKAQQLFGMDWKEFTGLPSRYSAELASQDDRAGLLQRVTQHGFADNYSGIRIAKNGARFNIGNATVWNLLDKCGYYCGQAALIRQWQAI